MNRLTMTASLVFAGVFAAVASGGAGATHNHITVDTPSGSNGDQIVIAAGYLGGEVDFSIDPQTGQVLYVGKPADYHTEDYLPAPNDAFLAGDALVLTSDYFASSGHLDGGNFAYEIVSVTPLAERGGPAPVVLWGDAAHGITTSSAASTRAGRSYVVGAGGHQHGQYYAVNQAGEFDVALVAWDINGRYADSDPVVFRLHAVPPPCDGDFNGDGAVNTADLVRFLGTFGQKVPQGTPQDFNGDGAVNTADLTHFLGRFGQPC